MASTPVTLTPKALARRERILKTATSAFCSLGFDGASVEQIAADAHVSKPTIYSYFGTKSDLFLTVLSTVIPGAHPTLAIDVDSIEDHAALRRELVTHLIEWGELALSDDVIALRRLVINEIPRFPTLSGEWQAMTYERVNRPLAASLEALCERGLLKVDQPQLAVAQLIGMTVGIPQTAKTFTTSADSFVPDLNVTVPSGVDVFLAGYAV